MRYVKARVLGIRTYSSFDARLDLGFGVELTRRIHIAGCQDSDFGRGPTAHELAFSVLISAIGGRTVFLEADPEQFCDHLNARVFAVAKPTVTKCNDVFVGEIAEGAWCVDVGQLYRAAVLQAEPHAYIKHVLA